MAQCPYCNQAVSLIADVSKKNEVRREVKGTTKKEVLYSCPHCDKVLGFAFFLGGWFTGRP